MSDQPNFHAAPGDEWLTIPEACDRAKVSRRTIYNWYAAGKIITIRTAGGSLRILESSLWGGTRVESSSSGLRKGRSRQRSPEPPPAL